MEHDRASMVCTGSWAGSGTWPSRMRGHARSRPRCRLPAQALGVLIPGPTAEAARCSAADGAERRPAAGHPPDDRRRRRGLRGIPLQHGLAKLMELANATRRRADAGLAGLVGLRRGDRYPAPAAGAAAPHVAEELWERRGKPYSIHQQPGRPRTRCLRRRTCRAAGAGRREAARPPARGARIRPRTRSSGWRWPASGCRPTCRAVPRVGSSRSPASWSTSSRRGTSAPRQPARKPAGKASSPRLRRLLPEPGVECPGAGLRTQVTPPTLASAGGDHGPRRPRRCWPGSPAPLLLMLARRLVVAGRWGTWSSPPAASAADAVASEAARPSLRTRASRGEASWSWMSRARVAEPGIQHLPAGSRVADAIAAAGGYGPDADLAAAARQLNLAAPLSDGQQVYVPRIGDTRCRRERREAAASVSGLVNLNTATTDELDALPGIGPVTVAEDRRGPHGAALPARSTSWSSARCSPPHSSTRSATRSRSERDGAAPLVRCARPARCSRRIRGRRGRRHPRHRPGHAAPAAWARSPCRRSRPGCSPQSSRWRADRAAASADRRGPWAVLVGSWPRVLARRRASACPPGRAAWRGGRAAGTHWSPSPARSSTIRGPGRIAQQLVLEAVSLDGTRRPRAAIRRLAAAGARRSARGDVGRVRGPAARPRRTSTASPTAPTWRARASAPSPGPSRRRIARPGRRVRLAESSAGARASLLDGLDRDRARAGGGARRRDPARRPDEHRPGDQRPPSRPRV